MPLPRIQATIVRKLCESGLLDDKQAESLFESPEDMSGDAMEAMLRDDYKVSEFQILVAKAAAFDLHPFNAARFVPGSKAFEKIDRDFCKENTVLPVGIVGEYLVVAVADPFNLAVTSRIFEMTQMKVSVVLALEQEIRNHLKAGEEEKTSPGFGDVMAGVELQFGVPGEEEIDIDEDDLEEESAPIIQLANRIIDDAYFSGASDIHIEPFENYARVRVRVDGVCMDKLQLPTKVCAALLARLKVMSNLDIAEKRLPQDGRIVYKQYNKRGLDIDLRVATAPLNHGEGVVMRILDKQKSTLPLTALGFSDENLALYRGLITRPYGMILHCGPTGSGKSMTLYSALNEINSPEDCIRTAEDPIEYTLPGLCQMQMNRKIGLTFASALRAFLRQDPDIILVGEIRDTETAQIAVEAALTGHMLFSTLHTNDAPSTIARLTEMDIEPFMISASLVCVCAQRLLRRVCKNCREPYIPVEREDLILRKALDRSGEIHRAAEDGCPSCGGTGYRGRVGIHELLATSEDLVKGINFKMETAKLKKIAIRNGMKTLHQDSMLKVCDGTTTIQEAIGNVPPDMEDIQKILTAGSLEAALAE